MEGEKDKGGGYLKHPFLIHEGEEPDGGYPFENILRRRKRAGKSKINQEGNGGEKQ
jgi:hypothetical protein